MHILFVCTGNTCRSPMAAFLAQAKIAEAGLPWQVSSAGLYAAPGIPMTKAAVDALLRRQVLVGQHASQPVDPDLLERVDYVFTMTAAHRDDLLARFPEAAGKVYQLGVFVEDDMSRADGQCDIVDPFGGDEAEYEACAADLEEKIALLVNKLRQMEGGLDDEQRA